LVFFVWHARWDQAWKTHGKPWPTFSINEPPDFIPCDRRALDSAAITSARKTTDIYLADLAAARGWRFVTLDAGIAHVAADLIPEVPATIP
jgi:hypothetical protein